MAIIRYFRNPRDDEEQQIKTIMLLFHPFRDEQNEVHKNSNIIQKYKDKKYDVDVEREIFEPHPEFMEMLDNINTEDIQLDEEEQKIVEEEIATHGQFQESIKKDI